MGELTIGDYSLERKLKAGSAAEVHLGRHVKTQQQVAVKVFTSKACSKDSELSALVAAEIEAAKLLKHKHIVKVLDIIEEDDLVFIVMELAAGGDLLESINARRDTGIPEEEVKDLFAQLISALQYTHSQGFAHRDIKLENILLNAKGEILLTDWSLCCKFKAGQTCRDYVGSASYMSPEVMEGKLYEGPELDIWSAGIVLYALLFNVLPFEASTAEGIKANIAGGVVFPARRKVSDAARDLIRRMLKPAPEDRIKLHEIVSHPYLRNHPRLSSTTPCQTTLSIQQRYAKVYASMDSLLQESYSYCSTKAGTAVQLANGIMNRTLNLVCASPPATHSPSVSLDLDDDSSASTPAESNSSLPSTPSSTIV